MTGGLSALTGESPLPRGAVRLGRGVVLQSGGAVSLRCGPALDPERGQLSPYATMTHRRRRTYGGT